MSGAAGGLGPTQVFLYCRFFPGLPDYPALTQVLAFRYNDISKVAFRTRTSINFMSME